MSSESQSPANNNNNHNTRPFARDMSRTTGFGGTTAGMRDLNAHEWSEAVINELESVHVATPPPTKGYKFTTMRIDNENGGTASNNQDAKMSLQQAGEPNMKHTPLPDQRNAVQLEIPQQRPQAESMESTATIDVVKQIPGGW
ncbi:hypothetical protein ABW20_dc0110285 [Dactylellina cionopaga]|nr:hypothetical protein ABW20_dc0110285 [Dactylellina cionopaga]